MTPRPKIETDAAAVAYVAEYLDQRTGDRWSVALLWQRNDHFVVGARSDGDRRVYVVGPRGGLDLWISAYGDHAEALARFFR